MRLGSRCSLFLGAEKTLRLGFAEPVAIMMGVITVVAGGMIRDIFESVSADCNA